MYTLRELIKKRYIKLIVILERCLKMITTIELKNNEGFTWEEFTASGLVDNLVQVLPTVFDRMDYNRSLINYLELKYNFNIEKLEEFWSIYKDHINT